MASVVIHLKGRFRLVGPEGAEISVRSTKIQALLALLATDEQLTRTRVWLQDKLWSDRAPENAANSMRQVLFQLRKMLGSDASLLLADRNLISLDPKKVRVDISGTGDFLEGIDVRDPEFEAWLAVKRGESDGNAKVARERVSLDHRQSGRYRVPAPFVRTGRVSPASRPK